MERIKAVEYMSLFERHEKDVMNELMDMDFDGTDFVNYIPSEDPETVSSFLTPVDCQLNTINCKSISTSVVAKSSSTKRVGKLKQSELVVRLKRTRKVVTPVHELERTKFPNMSRKPRSHILYVFPTFDKCDSLVFFPNTLSKLLNSGDFTGLNKLFATHLDKNCDIAFCSGAVRPNPRKLAALFECMQQFHPDQIMCVHNTKVIENEIHADSYTKFTDSRSLRASLTHTSTVDSDFKVMFTEDRSYLDCTVSNGAPEPVHQKMADVMSSDVDIVVYMRIGIKLVFDECRKRVMRLSFESEITSVVAVE